jgi:hypothetical protein
MRIQPRRFFGHPTMQPIHRTSRKVVNVRIPSVPVAVAEYRSSAELLRSLGLGIAADLLAATAERLDPQPAISRTTTEPDTVVADVCHDTINELTAVEVRS